MSKHILFEKSAVPIVLKALEKTKGYRVTNVEYLNKNRYAVAYIKDKKPIAIILKTRWLESFKELARKNDWKNKEDIFETGIGDSLNVEDIKKFIAKGVETIYIIYQSIKYIYSISLIDFLTNSHKWTNKEGKELRSLSIHHYKNIHPSSE